MDIWIWYQSLGLEVWKYNKSQCCQIQCCTHCTCIWLLHKCISRTHILICGCHIFLGPDFCWLSSTRSAHILSPLGLSPRLTTCPPQHQYSAIYPHPQHFPKYYPRHMHPISLAHAALPTGQWDKQEQRQPLLPHTNSLCSLPHSLCWPMRQASSNIVTQTLRQPPSSVWCVIFSCKFVFNDY